MRAISLFSGIGGIDVAAYFAGFDVVAQVEIDPFCQDTLKRYSRYWQNAVLFNDVRNFGRHSIDGTIDLIFGGFPCQPFSQAGQRLADDDPRNMWGETRRIISEFQPRAILLENVIGLTQRLKDENGDVIPAYLGVVLSELRQIGYDAG